MSWRDWGRRPVAFAFLLALLALAFGAGPVGAHAQLVAAEPAAGFAGPSPAAVRLQFNEPLQPGSTYRLFDESFRIVSGISPAIVADEPAVLTAPLPPLPPGVYTVQWTAVGDDGHAGQGSYSFQVVAPEPAAPRPDLPPWGWLAGGLGLVVVGGLVLIGLKRRR